MEEMFNVGIMEVTHGDVDPSHIYALLSRDATVDNLLKENMKRLK